MTGFHHLRIIDRHLYLVSILTSTVFKGGNFRFKKRCAQAQELVSATVLAQDDLGIDVDSSFHHVFVFGDFNFRIADFVDPELILDIVHTTAIKERDRLHESDGLEASLIPWNERHWNSIAHPNELGMVQESSEESLSCSTFETLLIHDELSRARKAGLVFYGYVEGNITFPPTFRRSRGSLGNCGNYTDRLLLTKSFSTNLDQTCGDMDDMDDEESRKVSVTGGQANENDSEKTATSKKSSYNIPSTRHVRSRSLHSRPPSYTDRILWKSMPDVAALLQCLEYSSADAIIDSDHRPVAMASLLNIHRTQILPAVAPTSTTYVHVCIFNPRFSRLSESIKQCDLRLDEALFGTPYYCSARPNEVLPQLTSTNAKINPEPCTGISDPKGYIASDMKFGDSSSQEDLTLTGCLSIVTVELVFPIPAEDPLCGHRKGFGNAEVLGPYASRNLETQLFRTATSSRIKRSKVEILSSVSTINSEDFFTGKVRLCKLSSVSPSLGLHAVLKLRDKDGKTVAQGLICLKGIVENYLQTRRSHTEHGDRSPSSSHSHNTTAQPCQAKVEIDMTSGGRYLGKLAVSISCEVAQRIA